MNLRRLTLASRTIPNDPISHRAAETELLMLRRAASTCSRLRVVARRRSVRNHPLVSLHALRYARSEPQVPPYAQKSIHPRHARVAPYDLPPFGVPVGETAYLYLAAESGPSYSAHPFQEWALRIGAE